ncbi:MAG: hypothetical protein Q4D81_11480 [Eubacteriales bacterium]|nr:hypothetical protein [Eubacteriales bacterium]
MFQNKTELDLKKRLIENGITQKDVDRIHIYGGIRSINGRT